MDTFSQRAGALLTAIGLACGTFGAMAVRAQAAPAPAPAFAKAATAASGVVRKALGDSNSDLIFVPVPPCRIIDTRLAGGPIAANSTRSFKVNGVDAFQAQGGKDGGC